MDRAQQLSDKLRSDCGSFNFLGDSDACANTADVMDNFLSGNYPGGGALALLEQSEDGDDGAHDRLVRTLQNQLDALRVDYSDISAGDTFTDLGASIGNDLGNAGKKLEKAAFPVGAIVAAIAALVVAAKVL